VHPRMRSILSPSDPARAHPLHGNNTDALLSPLDIQMSLTSTIPISTHSFFQERLSDIYERKRNLMHDVSLPWPSQDRLELLTETSDGSFLLATILIELIDARDRPEDGFQKALTAEDGLDALFRRDLQDASCGQHFQQVIGTIMLLTEPISIAFLAHFFSCHLRTSWTR
ncbi:hypothetical protein DXG03_005342, partial [Asterophora parasitica]